MAKRQPGAAVSHHFARETGGLSESLEMLPQHAYQSVHTVKHYDTNGEVELAVLDIAKTHTIRAIVAQAEFDVERVARLRAYLNIPGQDEHSARCFRNKVTMKAVLQRANVPVAPFSAVQSVHTLLDFAQQYGFPLVVKPQNGAGSYGVTLLRDQSELDHFIAQGFTPALDVVPNLMVEQFVPGLTYHIDGIVVQGNLHDHSILLSHRIARFSTQRRRSHCKLYFGQRQPVD